MTQAGRYNAINAFANSIPQAIAPLTAPALLVMGTSGAEKNYLLLFLVAALFAISGGLIITKVRTSP